MTMVHAEYYPPFLQPPYSLSLLELVPAKLHRSKGDPLRSRGLPEMSGDLNLLLPLKPIDHTHPHWIQ